MGILPVLPENFTNVIKNGNAFWILSWKSNPIQTESTVNGKQRRDNDFPLESIPITKGCKNGKDAFPSVFD